MNKNVVIGIVVVIALAIVGWWYWTMMRPVAGTEQVAPSADQSINGVAVPNEDAAVALAGTWRSKQDARFVRVFQANGTIVDRYEGDDSATVTGTWNFVEDPAEEQAGLPVVKDAKVIKVQFPEEVMYFALLDLSETDLSMSYLGGAGGSLEFSRVQ